jgi:hypothetical protein
MSHGMLTKPWIEIGSCFCGADCMRALVRERGELNRKSLIKIIFLTYKQSNYFIVL